MYNLTLTNDFIFRNILGAEQNSDLLLSLINAIFESKGIKPVTGIHPVTPQLPVHEVAQREGVLDIRAIDSEKRQYDVELQVRSHLFFINRSIYYVARMYGGQLKRSTNFTRLKPCIGICILDFVLFPEDPGFHHLYSLRKSESPYGELSQDMTLHYLELPKVLKHVKTMAKDQTVSLNMLEKWLYLIKRITFPEDAMIKKITESTPVLDRTVKEYKQFMTSEQKRNEALAHEIWLLDQGQYKWDAQQAGRAEGLAEGLAEGRKEGIAKGITKGMKKGITEGKKAANFENAKKMKQKGFDPKTIREITGISLAEINAL